MYNQNAIVILLLYNNYKHINVFQKVYSINMTVARIFYQMILIKKTNMFVE